MSAPSSTADQYLHDEFQDETGKKLKMTQTLTTEYQCMIIGSYGNQYSSQIKDKVVSKDSIKPGGVFLRGVTDDLEIVQDMVMKDPRKHLAYVLPDVPGAQRPRSHYISKIEVFLKTCQKSGAMIWYTGHGEKMTGNWCFKDGVISMEDIIQLYQQNFIGRLLTIVTDCCYAGQWVCQLADKLDNLKIGACSHRATKAGLVLKIIASCQPNETAFDTLYAKERVNVKTQENLMLFTFQPIEIKQCGRFQTPIAIDTTKITCFSDHKDMQCKLDNIPLRAQWLWRDLRTNDDRNKLLQLRLFKVWGMKEQQPYWYLVVIFEDKFEDFCQVVKSAQDYDVNIYGHIMFSGYGNEPPPEIENIFCRCGPKTVNLPQKGSPTRNFGLDFYQKTKTL